MKREKQKIAEDIATQCNMLCEKAGYDPDKDGVGFDQDGVFYAITGDDIEEGLGNFFVWMSLELPNDIDTINTLWQTYNNYCGK